MWRNLNFSIPITLCRLLNQFMKVNSNRFCLFCNLLELLHFLTINTALISHLFLRQWNFQKSYSGKNSLKDFRTTKSVPNLHYYIVMNQFNISQIKKRIHKLIQNIFHAQTEVTFINILSQEILHHIYAIITFILPHIQVSELKLSLQLPPKFGLIWFLLFLREKNTSRPLQPDKEWSWSCSQV